MLARYEKKVDERSEQERVKVGQEAKNANYQELLTGFN